ARGATGAVRGGAAPVDPGAETPPVGATEAPPPPPPPPPGGPGAPTGGPDETSAPGDRAAADAIVQNVEATTRDQPQTKGEVREPGEIIGRATPAERAEYEYVRQYGRPEDGGVPLELTPEQRAARVLAGRPEPPPPGFMGTVPPPPIPGGEFVGPRQQPTGPFATLPGEGRRVWTMGPGGAAEPVQVTVGENPLSDVNR